MVLEERGIEFDFTNALSAKYHDRPKGDNCDGNTLWKGVDFRVELAHESIWVEVKNWANTAIPEKHTERQKDDFKEKMESESFRSEVRTKFLGTTAFLAWTKNFEPKSTIYIVVLKPPIPLDPAMLSTLTQRQFASFFPRKRAPWESSLSGIVIDLTEWNRRFPEFPARIV